MNGKRFAWQGVALLPFIEEARLLAATDGVLGCLSEQERYRNSTRMELLLVHSSHPLAPALYELEAKYGHLPASGEPAIRPPVTSHISLISQQPPAIAWPPNCLDHHHLQS